MKGQLLHAYDVLKLEDTLSIHKAAASWRRCTALTKHIAFLMRCDAGLMPNPRCTATSAVRIFYAPPSLEILLGLSMDNEIRLCTESVSYSSKSRMINSKVSGPSLGTTVPLWPCGPVRVNPSGLFFWQRPSPSDAYKCAVSYVLYPKVPKLKARRAAAPKGVRWPVHYEYETQR